MRENEGEEWDGDVIGLLRGLLQLPFLTRFAYCTCVGVYVTTCKSFVLDMNVLGRSGPHQVRTQVGGRE